MVEQMVENSIKGHTVVCSALIEKENKFLVVMCPRFKVWRVPGGRAEFGEKIEETLLREMKEETGVEYKNPIFLGWGQDQQFHVLKQKKTSRLIMYFHVKTDKELVLDPDEAEDHKWISFDELKNLEDKEEALNDLFSRHPDLSL